VNRSTRRRSAFARRVAFGVVLVSALLGTSAANAATTTSTSPGPGAIAPVRSGDVRVVDDRTRSRDLERGGSATEFGLRLPDGAACPGDSQNDQWRVDTYIIPITDDPGTLQYDNIGPTGSNRSAVWGTDFTPVMNLFTIPNTVSGQPGVIDRLRPMSFGVFQPNTLPDGNYKIGVSCTYFGRTANYWDTEIVISNTPDDKPAQLTWRHASAPGADPQPSDAGTPAWVGISIALAAAAAIALAILFRQSRRRVSAGA
jgi:hypothetical protein